MRLRSWLTVAATAIVLTACGETPTPTPLPPTATPIPPTATATATAVPTATPVILSEQNYLTATGLFADGISAAFTRLGPESSAADKFSTGWKARVGNILADLNKTCDVMLAVHAPPRYQDADVKFKESAQDFKEFTKQFAVGMAENSSAALQPALAIGQKASTALEAASNLMRIAQP